MEVRFFAGAAEAAGAESLSVSGASTVAALVDQLGAGNERLAAVLNVSSLLADGARVSGREASLDGVARVDVLPPFAGG
ncbi:MAG: MoaD/ThiS family protein [Tessaracoccus sp.]|uniref:MoaD/ThiS family protein n=1 Tax=Tessaracoccus sp. TaxID=1971211 RepID=UPI001ECAF26A|nr:MoaD/ThiS family protein [Tessaracoccus sp.]MBK7822740.1 MoaD/ThiS family protein [Tessaracoccus sp.]